MLCAVVLSVVFVISCEMGI